MLELSRGRSFFFLSFLVACLLFAPERPPHAGAQRRSQGVNHPIGGVTRAAWDEELMELVAYAVQAAQRNARKHGALGAYVSGQGVLQQRAKHRVFAEMSD